MNKAYASLYMATRFENTARTIMKLAKILSFFVAMLWLSLRVIAAGKIKPRQTAAVAPVNWKASQMLGMKFAPRKMIVMSPIVTNANLKFFKTKGLDEGKKRPSKLSRNGKKTIGKTSIR